MNGRPVRLAPRKPGASPTINRRASAAPKDATGAFDQSGYSARFEARNAASRGQSEHSAAGPTSNATGRGLPGLVAQFFGRLLDRPKLAAMVHGTLRPIAGVTADALDQMGEIDELIRLSAQFVRHHRRLG